ncbi:MAG: hypothetical protein IKU07_03385 [Oscillospiraceae bacterium]|nr:hypothetical protein [Oscillospiraceae bacterium]
MRRLLLCALALCILFSAVPLGYAEAPEGLEQLIYESHKYNREADITDYKLTYEEFDAIFDKMAAEGKLPWYAETGYSYSYNEVSQLLLSVTPMVSDPKVYDRTLYAQKLAAFTEKCILPGMTPLQIALSVHDQLALHNIYDESLAKNTGYDLLVHGTTVCAGYANLYTQILNSAGVPCITVTSDEMNHAWNLVQLDGSWYHVDVTWDDPTADIYGRVRHTYFLLTDAEISTGEEPHYGWDSALPCTNTRYADAYWRNVENPILFESSSTSYLLRNEDWDNYIYRRDEATGQETLLFSDTDHYVDVDDGGYAFVHRGLSLAEGRLYFNRQDTICSMNTDGSDVKTEYTYDTKANNRFIYGFWLDGDTLQLSLANRDYETETRQQTLAHLSDRHVHSFTVTQQAPTCIAEGYTLSVCDCGLQAESDHLPSAGHDLKVSAKKAATFFEAGYEEGYCVNCQQETSQEIPKINFAFWFLDNYKYMLIGLGVILLITIFSPSGKRKK